VGKAYNLCRLKNNISTLLTVKSGLDPHKIIKLKDDQNGGSLFIIVILSLLFI
jgi:hypothetical protein